MGSLKHSKNISAYLLFNLIKDKSIYPACEKKNDICFNPYISRINKRIFYD